MPSWPRSQGKRLKFGERPQKIEPHLTWNIANGVSGARTYPYRKSIKLKSKLFTESTGQVTLTLKRLDEENLHVGKLEVGNLNASTTTEDVLKWIYTACQSKLEQSGTSLKFQELLKERERHYIVKLLQKLGREKKY
jgi:hypothetical protein